MLETERKEGRLGRRDIENVGDGEREGGYVEMDLGLGVLEEKKEGGNEGYEGDGNESERSRVEEVGERVEREDVLGKMMGRKRSWGKGKGKVGIEEVRS